VAGDPQRGGGGSQSIVSPNFLGVDSAGGGGAQPKVRAMGGGGVHSGIYDPSRAGIHNRKLDAPEVGHFREWITLDSVPVPASESGSRTSFIKKIGTEILL
jgi:hypothetical protein